MTQPNDTGGPATGRCGTSTCYEAERQPNGQIKVWSSRYPENGHVLFDADEYARHLADVRAGRLDRLVAGAPVTA